MQDTNCWDVVIIFLYLVYVLAAFSGAAYLVAVMDWSAWWMLFPACCMTVRITTGSSKKHEKT